MALRPLPVSRFPLAAAALRGEGGGDSARRGASPRLPPPRSLPFPFHSQRGGYGRGLNIDVSSPDCSSVNPITEFIKNCVELSLSIQYQH